MRNRKGDLLWALVLLVWILILVIPSARTAFIGATEAHPYIGGFVKFAILATMGDLLGARILNKSWVIPRGFVAKACVWGVLGMAITLVFTVYNAGAAAAMAAGRLPFAGNKFALAFFTSFIMNVTFGPMLYMYHKYGDLLVETRIEKVKYTVKYFVDKIDWYTIVGFSWLKTCLLIWVPLHTIVFLLPAQYRVLASAFLSILLGVLVALTKLKSQAAKNAENKA
ncbi:hypothetical protein [Papillibacter cinnamivorans]|uniref:Mpv17 / PMP22 family protein n=1 Tax=Papillibacter cinnamivorans DSM 12816 TaxID=1122930 RepID=A0A1W2D307_9FIRM|nr:hypothetical protein [Papillibacter cinnamivorans]SMC91422.1 hypothetical protein SAMN02745168_0314 [Papillibacter cinnamivorans DSM 12816]